MEVRQDSQVDNTSALYANDGAVYNGPVSNQTISGGSGPYEIERENVAVYKHISRALLGTLGETKTRLGAILGFVLGGTSLATWTLQKPDVVFLILNPVLPVLAVSGFIIAYLLRGALKFRDQTRCPECTTLYSMAETGQPIARDIDVYEGTRRIVTRYYKCSNCSHELTRKTSTILDTQ